MKKFIIFAIALIIIAGAVYAVKDVKPKGELYGEKISGEKITAGKIISSEKTLEGKKVVLEGKIVEECPSGCWFNVDDGTGKVKVDLAPASLAIPQKVNSEVKLIGTVKNEAGTPVVYGSGLELR
jgi:uncharacterized protein YdeI (BOF family)